MRTTLTIEDDVLDRARAAAEHLNTSFRHVINEALRAGLRTIESPAKSRPYHTLPHKMGLRQGRNVDNIQDLIAQIEGENTP
jgi:hypothetical protein